MSSLSAASGTVVIDGKALASALRGRVAHAVRDVRLRHGVVPGLAVVLVGDDPASHVYVRNKVAQTREAGMESFEHRLPAATGQAELLALIGALNADDSVSGILVQLPLPGHLDEAAILVAICPDKDVDGFHPVNAGRLATGQPLFVPCTPLGCSLLVDSVRDDIAGAEAVVIGRSNIVGKPMAQLLLSRHCTVTVAHSRTRDLPQVVRRADIVVAAVGRPLFVREDWIKPGATVIDVGTNRVAAAAGGTRLVGDVAFDEVARVAGAITPVPGGVGPMTIACLLRNTLVAACSRHALPHPPLD